MPGREQGAVDERETERDSLSSFTVSVFSRYIRRSKLHNAIITSEREDVIHLILKFLKGFKSLCCLLREHCENFKAKESAK